MKIFRQKITEKAEVRLADINWTHYEAILIQIKTANIKETFMNKRRSR